MSARRVLTKIVLSALVHWMVSDCDWKSVMKPLALSWKDFFCCNCDLLLSSNCLPFPFWRYDCVFYANASHFESNVVVVGYRSPVNCSSIARQSVLDRKMMLVQVKACHFLVNESCWTRLSLVLHLLRYSYEKGRYFITSHSHEMDESLWSSYCITFCNCFYMWCLFALISLLFRWS